MSSGRILDGTALFTITDNRTVYAGAFVAAAHDLKRQLVIPATALQEFWATADDAQHPFMDLLLSLRRVEVLDLDVGAAQDSGLRARQSVRTGAALDPAAAHAVSASLRTGWPVLTAEPDRLLAVDLAVGVEQIPID